MDDNKNKEIMLNVPDKEKIFLITGYTDMRKGIYGLCDYVESLFNLTPYDGSSFFFCGRRADRCKLLTQNAGGIAMINKIIEGGRLRWPRKETEAWRLSIHQLEDLLNGNTVTKEEIIEIITNKLY